MRPLLVAATIVLVVLAQGALLPPQFAAPEMPAALVGDDAWLAQAKQLTNLRLGLYLADLVLPPIGLWLFVRSGRSARLRRRLRDYGLRNEWVLVAVFSTLLFAGLALLTLPLAFAGYLLRQAYGLTAETPSAWGLRFASETAVSGLPLVIATEALYWLFRRFPQRWWLLATPGYMLASLALVYLYPLVITPLLYIQRPLTDQALRHEIIRLGQRIGMDVEQVFVLDASARGAEGNAYVAGVGGASRIVLYDTLLEAYPTDEFLTIVAHELGHWRERHIWKGLFLSWTLSPFVFVAAQRLMRATLPRWGIRHLSDIAGLPLLLLLLNLATLATLPLQNWQSRRWEAEADRIAVAATGDPDAFARTFARLARQNLSDPAPPRLVETLFATHPAIGRRINSTRTVEPDA